jgi:hypothetical protein
MQDQDTEAQSAASQSRLLDASGEAASITFAPARMRSRTAITDLYDEQRSAFLVQYPVWLVVGMGISGFLVIAVTGFTGYEPGPPFGQPWLLFLWLCSLAILLQVSIFRHPSLAGYRIAAVLVTLMSVLAVGVGVSSYLLPTLIAGVSSGPRVMVSSAWTYVALNSAILALFAIDVARRLLRRARGLRTDLAVTLEAEESANQTPSLTELIAGESLIGAALAILLAVLFTLRIWTPFWGWVGVGMELRSCPSLLSPSSVSCLIDSGSAVDWAIALDLVVAAICVLVFCVVVTLNLPRLVFGLEAPGRRASEPSLGDAAPLLLNGGRTRGQLVWERRRLAAANAAGVALRVVRAGFELRLRVVSSSTILSLRLVLWPALIVLAIYAFANAAFATQHYLHSSKAFGDSLGGGLVAVLWVVGAALAITFSAALMVFRWRVAENTLRFLGFIGLVLLLTFWLFSVSLAGFNLLLLPNLLNVTARTPFLPIGLLTYVSIAALVGFAVLTLQRRMVTRRRQTVQGPKPIH